mmetsp:Transcript_26739/g.64795  ORF Transcript_26739/g.64795 Transcript_26739/m.64795 type:complete len:778 (-) Transcript_26739:324-2657(-)
MLQRRQENEPVAPGMTDDQFLALIQSGKSASQFERVNDKGDSSMILACRAGRRDIVHALLKAKANVNKHSDGNSTPLTAAAMRGYKPIVKLLLEEKAEVNTVTNTNDTPLSLAVWKNHGETALILLEAGADCKRVDRFGDTVLIDACKNGNFILVKKLVETGDLSLNHQNNEGMTPLICCSMNRHTISACFLLDRKADPNIVDSNNTSALMHAASSNDLVLCKKLLEARADPSRRNTAGHWAGSLTQNSQIQQLFQNVVPASTIPFFEQQRRDPAALIAPPFSDEDFIAKVVKGEVDVNDSRWRLGENNERPLIRASRTGNLDHVKILIKAKAKPDEVNAKGSTPLIAAAMRGFTPIVKYLVETYSAKINRATKNGDTALSLACWKDHPETAIYLIEKGADLKRVDSFGDNILIDASKNGSADLVQKLVDTKAFDLGHVNREGQSCLTYAVGNKHEDTVEILLEAKANANQTFGDDNTPLILASQGGTSGICRALLKAKANPNHTNAAGMDAVAVAHPDVRNMLLSLRLRRRQSFTVDESIPWTTLTRIKKAIDYICSEQKNTDLAPVIIRGLEHDCCAEFVGDLLTIDPETWEALSMPKRFKAMLQEIVRIAREKAKKFSSEEKEKDNLRRLAHENRFATKRARLDMYKSIIEMAVEDEVLTKTELEKISQVRLKHKLTLKDHELVLKEIGLSKQQYAQFTQNQLPSAAKGTESKQSQQSDLMQCIVCLDARCDHVILPCMHMCLCGDCAPFYKEQQGLKCPKCRQSVKSVVKVFM